MTARRAGAWLGLVVLLELVARCVVYGLAPSSTARATELGSQLGGPGFSVVLIVALGLGAALSVMLVWMASIGVRERWELAERRLEGDAPRVDVRRLLVRAGALTLAGWLAFAGVESIIHLRAGLGFHGLDCLVGPVHRNALPVIGGLALLSSALLSAAALVLAWMRRTVGRLVVVRAVVRHRLSHAGSILLVIARRAPRLRGTPPRGPPAVVA
jgi:hypothetical protein